MRFEKQNADAIEILRKTRSIWVAPTLFGFCLDLGK